MYPEELKYLEEHQWVKVEGNIAVVGLTKYLTDHIINFDEVFVDIEKVGTMTEQMIEIGSVEIKNKIHNLYSPVSGEIIEINQDAIDDPEIIAQDPYEEGWLFKISIADEKEVDDLLSASEYLNFLKNS